MTKENKPAEKPEPAPKADKRGDPHDRLDRLEAVMRANGWTVD